MTFEIEQSVLIDRPVEEVFEHVTTPEKDEEWIDVIVDTPPLDEELAEGTTWSRTAKFMGSTELVMECTLYDPPDRFGYRTISGFAGDRLMTDEVFTFAREGERTRFSRSATVEVRGVMRPFQAMLAPMIRKGVAESHENLNSILEANEELHPWPGNQSNQSLRWRGEVGVFWHRRRLMAACL